MRLCLFTDTLHDINGVSRFIRNIGHEAQLSGRELHLITSTRLPKPDNIDLPDRLHNSRPLIARPMPGYPQLEIVLPRRSQLRQLSSRLAPDIIHVSTPGPVGMFGRAFALKHNIPLVGTYHTDFPAYIDHLFNEPAFTRASSFWMKTFYRPFSSLFTRSDDYAKALQSLSYPRERIVRLQPGIDTSTFSTHFKDHSGSIWTNQPGVRASSLKILYVGRISVEKNLPLLTHIWPAIRAAALQNNLDVQLIVIGDGPYRQHMQAQLAHHDVCFLGFRHGTELSTLYASSDLFLFPSTTDTLGQVVMEAQAAGLPVIVTDQGGPSEVVDNHLTGLVLPAHRPELWIREISALLTDPDRRRRMGQAAAAKIAPMSIRNSFEHFWQVHEHVCSRTDRPMPSNHAQVPVG